MKILPVLAFSLACLSLPAQARPYTVETVATGLEHPWSIAFLDADRILVSERPGRLRLIDRNGLRPEPVAGLPAIFVSGQAGLFDILPARDFADSGMLFISFAHGDEDANHTRIVRARFDGDRLLDVQPIFTAQPPKSGDAHYGARMAWNPDGTLLMGTGDGFYFRELPQQLDNHHGKIIRIHDDGSVPADNPFTEREGALPEIYSFGHRNVQAIVVDARTGLILAHEHGPRGGDELNRIRRGANYGWPLITYGRDYSRSLITPFTERPGLEQPLLHWTPSIAPSGMAFYQGSAAAWRNSLFVGALAEKSLRRLTVGTDGEPLEQEVLLQELGERIRDVRSRPGTDAIYVVTDEPEGRVLRIRPAATSLAPVPATTGTQP